MKMINRFATSLAFLLIGFAASAQVRFDVGLKGGLNFASVNASSTLVKNYEGRTGYHLGAYAMVKLTKFAIQPEIIFSRQGQTFATPSVNNLDASFDYINIPVMIKFYIVGGLNIHAGPQFGFLASANGDILNNVGGTVTVTKGQDISSLVSSSDISLGVGAGLDLPLGLNVSARYNIGLSDINKFTNNTIPGNTTSSLGTSVAKNQVFQFSVGYRLFKLGN